MADSRDFKIRIITEADTAAAKDVGRTLEDVGTKGKAAHEQITQGAEHSHISHRALTIALRQMGPEFAHLGHLAVYGFGNPMVLGLLAATAAAGALIHHFEKIGEAAKEAQDKQNAASKNMLESMRGAREEVEKMNTETGTTVKNLDSIIHKFKEIQEPEKGQRTSEQVEKAIREVAGELAKIDSPDHAARLARAKALPAIIAAHEAEAEEFRKKKPDRFEPTPFGGFRPLTLEEQADQQAGFTSRSTKESLAAQRGRDELSGLQREMARQSDLEAQLTHLSQMQEGLPGSRASRTGGVGLGFPTGSLFNQALIGADIAGKGGLAPEQTQRDMASMQRFLSAHGMKEKAQAEFWTTLADQSHSVAERMKYLEVKLRSIVNKGT